MKCRLIVTLIALAGLTAFAPAPLPRVQRRGDSATVSLRHVQGDWRVASFESITGPNNQRSNIKWFEAVSIKGDELTYLNNGKPAHSPFHIAIDGSKRPATIEFEHGGTKPIFIGIVRRQGNRFTILYQAASLTRPTSFENIPLNWWLLELERP